MIINNVLAYLYKNIIAIGFTLIVSTMVFSSLYSVLQMRERSQITINTVEQQNYNTELLSDMSHAVLKRSMILMEMIENDDPFKNDELFLKLNELKTEFVLSRARFESQDLTPKLQNLVNQQSELIKVSGPMVDNFYNLILQDKLEAVQKYKDELFPKLQINLELIQEMVNTQFSNAQNSLNTSKVNRDNDFNVAIVINLTSIILSILMFSYINRKQKLSEFNLTTLATTDVLTSLPNRSHFIENIEETISKNPLSTFALIFFDIDYFKSINDNYGHEAGDEVLKLFSNKVHDSINSGDLLSRFGGDEFVLLLKSINNEQQAHTFIEKLSKSLDTSFKVGENQIFVSASIGASLYTKVEPYCAKTLLKNADIAMYSAKESGRNCYKFFSKESSAKMEKEHAINHALHTILKEKNSDNQLYLVYQPLLNINSGDFSECEALLRWKNTDGKIMNPDVFIPLAEKSNLIEKINLFVIDQACNQQLAWHEKGIKDIRININLSGNKQIFKNLLSRLEENIKKLRLKPSNFGIELTERTLFEICDFTVNRLKAARKQGMKIAIDDFGTGYSSLSYLKKLPITTLKIDQGFIAGLPEDKDDQALVKAIITLGHSMQLEIVAEGVETREQFEFLERHSCNVAQGYYFHKPLNCKRLSKLKNIA